MPRVTRLDTSTTFAHAGPTPTGGMRIDAVMTSVGVFAYDWADGRTMRELRHPDEVFAPASVESLIGAAVTLDHPKDFVTPETHAALSKGHVSTAAPTTNAIAGKVDVNAADALEAIKRPDDPVVECSCGYNADVEEESGEWEGQPYDAIQKNIRYNHVALGPRGWGRHGSQVALRTDAKRDRGVVMPTEPKIETSSVRRVHRIDGVPYDVGGDAFCEAVDVSIKRHSDRADKAEAELKTALARADKAEKDLAIATDPKAIATRVDERAKLLSLHARFVARGDKKKDLAPGTSSDEILKMVLKALKPTAPIDKMTPEQIAGAVLALTGAEDPNVEEPEIAPPIDAASVNPVSPTGDARGLMRGTIKTPTDARADGSEDVTVEQLKARADAKTKNAWKQKRSA